MPFLCPVQHLAFNVLLLLCDCYVLGHCRRFRYNYQKMFFYICHIHFNRKFTSDWPIRHLWNHPASRIWACAETGFRLWWMKLCNSDKRYTVVPQWMLIWIQRTILLSKKTVFKKVNILLVLLIRYRILQNIRHTSLGI